MTLSVLTDWALVSLSAYGPLALVFIAYIGSLGIPFPITVVIAAAGALSRAGLLDWQTGLLACLAGAALADTSEYLLGRLAQPWLRRRFEQRIAWVKAQETLNRQGGWAVLLTRFWLTPLAPAVNVLAGGRYPFARFVLFDLSGQLLWVLLYGGLGYLFAAQWEQASQLLSTFSALSVGLVLLALGAWFLLQRLKTKFR
jgi:membrane protein DedA with SNARE-associated domain